MSLTIHTQFNVVVKKCVLFNIGLGSLKKEIDAQLVVSLSKITVIRISQNDGSIKL